jgi:hypothetical protein
MHGHTVKMAKSTSLRSSSYPQWIRRSYAEEKISAGARQKRPAEASEPMGHGLSRYATSDIYKGCSVNDIEHEPDAVTQTKQELKCTFSVCAGQTCKPGRSTCKPGRQTCKPGRQTCKPGGSTCKAGRLACKAGGLTCKAGRLACKADGQTCKAGR